MSKLSNYAEALPAEAKRRYIDKLRCIGGVDPLCIQKFGVDIAQPCPLPLIDAADIVSYLVLQTSYITAKQFKAHKSLEEYNQFVSVSCTM